jgi:hypothetical protein
MVYTTEIINKIIQKNDAGEELKKSEKIFYRNITGCRNKYLDFNMTIEEILEYGKCQSDIIYFAEKYLGVVNFGVYSNLKLRDYQKDVISDFKNRRFNIVLLSRQIGMTIVESILILHDAIFNFDRKVLLIEYKTAIGLEKMNKIKELYLRLPFFLKPGITSLNTTNILFDNYSEIKLVTKNAEIYLDNTNILLDCNIGCDFDPYEYDPYDTVFINELSKMNITDQEKIIKALSCIISNVNSKIFISSTPNGYDHFYEIFQNSERKTKDPKKNVFKGNRIYWWEVDGRDDNWRQEEIKKLGSEEIFDQEYDLKFNVKRK